MLQSEDLQALLQKQLSRRQFLTHIGIALIAVTGLPGLLKSLNSSIGNNRQAPDQMPAGAYGWSGYSGVHPNTLPKQRIGS